MTATSSPLKRRSTNKAGLTAIKKGSGVSPPEPLLESKIIKKYKTKNMTTKKQFKTYLEIRDSGATNMFDVKKVVELSDGILKREDCIFIMKNFNELWDKYGEQKHENSNTKL